MWIADGWKDYQVIDTSSGEKLEKWGDYILLRPDPQVIWKTPKTDPAWNKLNAHYHRSAKGGGEWEFFDLPDEWTISYRELTFRLKPFSFKHTGLFPEQAVNWDWMSEKIKNAGPFGTVLIYEGKLYIQTGKVKAVSRQLAENPKAEVCVFKNGEWIRVSGELVEDDRIEVKEAMLDQYPNLKAMYSADDPNTQVFYFKNAVAVIAAFTHEPEIIEFG